MRFQMLPACSMLEVTAALRLKGFVCLVILCVRPLLFLVERALKALARAVKHIVLF
jgi:hypothetical protein